MYISVILLNVLTGGVDESVHPNEEDRHTNGILYSDNALLQLLR